MLKLAKYLVITVAFVFLTPLFVYAAGEEICQDPTIRPCCDAWMSKLDSVDDEWKKWWQTALRKSMNTSSMVKYATSALRTYSCDLREVCKNLAFSVTEGKQIETPGNQQALYLSIIGCFNQDDQRKYTEITECTFKGNRLDGDKLDKLLSACDLKGEFKFEEGKVFVKKTMRRDAAHKKAGFLLAKLRNLLMKIRNDLLENVEQMVSNFDKLTSKISCTIEQCD